MGRGGHHHRWHGCRGRGGGLGWGGPHFGAWGNSWAEGGPEGRAGQYHSSFSSSDSSSDSDNESHESRKKAKKQWKKNFKKFRKFGHFRHFMFDPRFAHFRPDMRPGSSSSAAGADPNCLKTMCTLCYHRIKPLVDTEVLECGHLYHRLCLKELFDLSLNRDTEQTEVFCSECKVKVDDNLVNQFRIRFNGQPTGPHLAGQHMVVMDDN